VPSLRRFIPSRARLLSAVWAGGLQILLVGSVWLTYELSRGAIDSSFATAADHGLDVYSAERSVGLDWEGPIQRALDLPVWHWVLTIVYMFAQEWGMPLALIVLYWVHRGRYTMLRDVLLISWMVAIPLHALYPTAPPRLLSLGLEDWIEQLLNLGRTTHGTIANPYAAIPSLHVGFAVAIGIALAGCVRHRALRALLLSWGPLIWLSTIATGNHFVLDGVAGIAVVAAAWLAARRLPWHQGEPEPRALPLRV
jgi:membrane-associated phospholipid phosphatase